MSKTQVETCEKIQNYLYREKLFLKIGGINLTGDESRVYKIYSIFIVYGICTSFPLLQAIEMFRNEFSVAAEAGLYFNATSLALSMIIVLHLNRVRVGKLLDKIEQKPFLANQKRGGDIEQKLINAWFAFKQKQSLTLFVAATCTFSLSVIYALINRIRSNDYHDWVLTFGPVTVLNVTSSPNYEISWMYQNTAIFYIGVNLCGAILILAAMLSFISVQFKMLQNNLKQSVKNSYQIMLTSSVDNSVYSSTIDISKIPWKYLKQSIKEAVDFHVNISELAKDLTEIFSIGMLCVYMFSLATLCLEVFRASTLPAEPAHIAVAIIEALATPSHAFLMCYNGQQMTNEGLNVATCAYEVNFVGGNVRFQKALSIIINRSQKPEIIKAGKFIDTSVLTLLWIVRSGYSAFMVLRNVQNK